MEHRNKYIKADNELRKKFMNRFNLSDNDNELAQAEACSSSTLYKHLTYEENLERHLEVKEYWEKEMELSAS